MRTLHIILPMAGRGSRFADAGYTTPKPLIPVDGKPMFMKALSSFDALDTPKRYTVILRKQHENDYHLGDQLKAILPEINIIYTDEEPIGALRDAYRALPYLLPDEGTLIMDCDIMIGGKEYFNTIRESLENKNTLSGALLLFRSDSPRYSYAELDDLGIVIRTAEKKVISSYAIGGGYFISSTDIFCRVAKAELEKPLSADRPEHYVSYLFNSIIEQGGKIKGVEGSFVSFGTPDELNAYIEHPGKYGK